MFVAIGWMNNIHLSVGYEPVFVVEYTYEHSKNEMSETGKHIIILWHISTKGMLDKKQLSMYFVLLPVGYFRHGLSECQKSCAD